VTRRPQGTVLAAPAAVHLGSSRGWVAICTLAERGLPARLALAGEPALGLAGPLLTVPRGLERLVANLAARPAIRALLLCGRDSRGGPAREAIRRLWAAGLTPAGRIRGLPGLGPLRNLDSRSLALVRTRVTVADLGPTRHAGRILRAAHAIPRRPEKGGRHLPRVLVVQAPTVTPRDHGLDPAGYFVILAPTPDGRICCEHYRRDGTLTRRFLGRGIPGSVPLVQHLTLVVGMVGGAIAAREGRLLTLGTIETHLRGAWRAVAQVVSSAFGATVSAMLCLAAARFVASEREAATVGIFTDLRDKLQLERKLSDAEIRLEESEKNAVIVALAGTAAHELNQPLTSVMGYAELLKKKMNPEDPYFRAVDTILREATRMAEIVKKIGRITRYETKAYVGSAQILDLEKSAGPGDGEGAPSPSAATEAAGGGGGDEKLSS